jgi:hypothetical protein
MGAFLTRHDRLKTSGGQGTDISTNLERIPRYIEQLAPWTISVSVMGSDSEAKAHTLENQTLPKQFRRYGLKERRRKRTRHFEALMLGILANNLGW